MRCTLLQRFASRSRLLPALLTLAPAAPAASLLLAAATAGAAQVAFVQTYLFNGDGAGDRLGTSVSGAGDVNNDGFDDVIVGAPYDDNNGNASGSARVFSGADGSILYTLNGDGAVDLFGHSVSGAGDVNNDGFDDFIVGAHRDDNNGTDSGSARVFSGATGLPLYTFNGDGAFDEFGCSVSGAGDVNNDGYADLIVGARHDDNNGSDSGSVFVFSGWDWSILRTYSGNSAGDNFGAAVGGAGDVNNDGFDDFIVGAYADDATGELSGSVRVYSGRDDTVLRTFDGNGEGREFGNSVSGAGDVNNDGFADLIVGAWGDDNHGENSGSAHVFSGFDGSTLRSFNGDGAGNQFGVSVDGAGDVDYDGFDDLIVGSWSDDQNGQDSGSARIFSGATGAILRTLHGDALFNNFGISVSGAGDLNNDGYDDVIVGEWFAGTNGLNSGSAHVFTPVPFIIVDPNYPGSPLIYEGVVESDADLLANYGVERQGLAADGVTRLLLRWEVPAAGSVDFSITDENGSAGDVGSLSAPGGPDSGTMLSTPAESLSDGRWMAFALLWAPIDFARGPGDFSSISREVRINATYAATTGGSASVSRKIQLRRPPLVLMHGLWSSAGTWGWPLQNDARFRVTNFDYRPNNAHSFAHNSGHAQAAVLQAVGAMRNAGFAATQVDYIGHSMGGLLGRLHVAGPTNARSNNYMAGDLHKLITLDTPHAGSPLCNVLVTDDGYAQLPLGPLVGAVLGSVERGAIFDMRTDSDAILNMPAATVPAHAAVGTGGSDIIEHIALQQLPLGWRALVKILDFLGVIDSIFSEEFQHDLIVGRVSQEGGLDAAQTSLFGLQPPLGLGVHVSVPKEDRIGARVIELLNARATDGAFALGFPAGPGRALPTEELDLPRVASSGLVITSPQPGAVLAPGALITVEAEALPGFEPVSVLFVGPEDAAEVEGPPFSTTLQLPESIIGDVTFLAIGVDANGDYFMSEPVAAVAQPTAMLTGITVQPSEVWLSDEVPALSLIVLGMFDDNVERDLTSAGLGTTYESSDETIALVDAAGEVTAAGDGTTIIQVTNGGFVAAATVYVAMPPPPPAPCPGDADANGSVNFSDITSVLSNWDASYPDTTSPGDADHDGAVNFADITSVLANWGATCP